MLARQRETFVDDLSGPFSHRPAISQARAAEVTGSRACLQALPARDIRDRHEGDRGQSFRYRGAERVSTSGSALVIHPDGLHDGHASGENLTLDAQCRGRFSTQAV